MRLAGRTCIVTAAAAGIGRATAIAMAGEGGQVVATDFDLVGLERLVGKVPALATRLVDVRSAAAIDTLAELEADVLVNVAGSVPSGTILDWTEEAWAAAIDLNVTSMIRCIRAVLPGMIERGRGSIVNMASVASSITGAPNRFIYGATKAAVIGLTKGVAADFVSKGIRCNAIAPGTIDTPSLQQRLHATGDYEGARRAFTARQPMGRLGRAEEVAALAVHLASDEASFTTGQTYVIDGGWTM